MYHTLLDSDKLWYITSWMACFELFCDVTSSQSNLYKIGCDTNINNVEYYQLLKSRDTSSAFTKINTFLHEDTAEKKVYILDTDVNSSKKLMYDFSLEKNDTAVITNSMNCERTMNVDSVDSININGEYRKRLYFTSNGGPPETWIEGIGSSFGVIYAGVNDRCIIDGGYELSCVFQNDSLLYKATSGNCYQESTGFKEETVKSNFSTIKPNPVTGTSQLFIRGEASTRYFIKIINILGEEQVSYTLNGQTTITINNSEYNPGIYIYMVFKDKRLMCKNKFIIQ